mgnify:CR=1 FL=1
MNNPRINQCMSCRFFSGTYFCNHPNTNNPEDKGFCYDYGDLEEDGPYTELEDSKYAGACDLRDERINRRFENE